MGKEVPQVVDILNCSNGCNVGSATAKKEHFLVFTILNEIHFRIQSQAKDKSLVRKK
jgi:hypothetical protein